MALNWIVRFKDTLIFLRCRIEHLPDEVQTMPDQFTLAMQVDGGFEAHREATPRDDFVAEMEKVMPWSKLWALMKRCIPRLVSVVTVKSCGFPQQRKRFS
jgi:hypothetical protein